MSKFKTLVALCSLSLLWLLAWVFVALYASQLYSIQFSYSMIRASFYQCFNINLFRIALYLILFYGQLLIFKAISGKQSKFANYFKISFRFDAVKANLKQLKNQSIISNLQLILKNITWVVYWGFLSFTIFLFTSTHLMGNCDDGDLECTCYNILYLLPVFLATLLLGCLYITAMNYQKSEGNT